MGLLRIPTLGRLPRLGAPGGGGAAPFDPISLSPDLWLKADAGLYQDAAGTTPATEDGHPVGLWQDQSGNGYDVSQSVDVKRPAIKTLANGINNRPALLFDGLTMFLLRSVAGWLSANSAGCIFIVARIASLATPRVILASRSEANADSYFMLRTDTTNGNALMIFQRNNDTADQVAGAVPSINTSYIFKFSSTGTAYGIRVNGADGALSVVSGANNGDWLADTANRVNLTIGASKSTSEAYFFAGMVSEIIAFPTDVTGDNLTKMEAYLNARYSCF